MFLWVTILADTQICVKWDLYFLLLSRFLCLDLSGNQRLDYGLSQKFWVCWTSPSLTEPADDDETLMIFKKKII